MCTSYDCKVDDSHQENTLKDERLNLFTKAKQGNSKIEAMILVLNYLMYKKSYFK
jgi:type II secretory pathway predicted ATPase ExeA